VKDHPAGFDFVEFGAGMVQYAKQTDAWSDSLPVFADYFIPPELEAAVFVDGATIWQAFRFVAMPLARPGGRCLPLRSW
jgi:hypothetical protein